MNLLLIANECSIFVFPYFVSLLPETDAYKVGGPLAPALLGIIIFPDSRWIILRKRCITTNI